MTEINCFNNKTVAVTGATGLLGGHIVNRLLQLGDVKVIAIGRSIDKLKKTFCEEDGNKNLVFFEHNISNELPEELGEIDYIFHAASPISGQVIRTTPIDVIKANLNGTINCFEYIKRQKEKGIHGKVIIFSSATMYSKETAIDNVAKEDNTSFADNIDSPNSPYSESKRMIEVISNSYHHQFGIGMIIVRFSYLYGYSKNPAKTAFYEFVNKALNGENIELNHPGLPRRDNIYVDDAVNGLFTICERGKEGEAYNVSSCGDKKNYAAIDEIAEVIAKETNALSKGHQIRVDYMSDSLERTEGLRLSNEKLKQLGWEIKYSLEKGIKDTLINFKKYGISK